MSKHTWPEVVPTADWRDHRWDLVSIFCGTLRAGKYPFPVTLRPRYPGSFTLNPAKGELVYFPVFFGRTGLTE